MKPYVDKALEILENSLQIAEHHYERCKTMYNVFKDNKHMDKEEFEKLERHYAFAKNQRNDLQNALRILYEQGTTRI